MYASCSFAFQRFHPFSLPPLPGGNLPPAAFHQLFFSFFFFFHSFDASFVRLDICGALFSRRVRRLNMYVANGRESQRCGTGTLNIVKCLFIICPRGTKNTSSRLTTTKCDRRRSSPPRSLR
jgi:hypothetical protein